MAAKKVIDENNIANVYLFYGEEAFKRRNYKEKLKKLVAGEGSMNYAAFEGKDIDFSAVYDNVVTMPFFAEKRLVIVENSGKFKASKKAASGDEGTGAGAGSEGAVSGKPGVASDKADAMIEKILKDLPESTVLAFFEEEINKTKKIYKTIASRGVVCECAPDNKETLVMWLAKGFAGVHKKVRRSTVELIIDRAGTDYDRLRQEFEKIAAYVGDCDEVTDDDVLAVTSEDIESRIFEMLDAMCAGDTQKVMEKYYGLIANREHPLYILAMIRIQMRTMLHVAELDREGRSKYEIAQRLKKRDFVIEKSLRNTRHFTPERIEKILDDISDVDMRIKTGDVDEQIGVEMLLVECSKLR